MYCWGSMKHGELGLGGLEEEIMTLPKLSPFAKAEKISQGIFSFAYVNTMLAHFLNFFSFQLELVTTIQSYC